MLVLPIISDKDINSKWQVKDSPLLVQQLQDMRQAVESLQASNARLVADDLRDRISRWREKLCQDCLCLYLY